MIEKKVCSSGSPVLGKLEAARAIEATASIAAWAAGPKPAEAHAITDARDGEVTVDLLNREFMAVLKRLTSSTIWSCTCRTWRVERCN